MAICKEVLTQYIDLQKEAKELRIKIEKLEDRIPKLDKRIAEIEAGEIVKDKVKGGLGGVQHFNIEGIPTKEYNDKKTELYIKKRLLAERKEMLNLLELDSMRQINQVEKFIKGIKDSHIRRIVSLRVVNGLSWNEVADNIGGGNTEGSVKMAFQRFLEKN